MTRIQSPALNRRQSLLSNKHAVPAPAAKGGGRSRFSEAAGRTAADCAALCCCCPCTVMDVLVLAVYKVPAGLCRKASMKKRQKKRAASLCQRPAGGFTGRRNPSGGSDDFGYGTEDSVADLLKKGDVDGADENDAAAGVFEREMWARFHGAGFWRSPSTRDT